MKMWKMVAAVAAIAVMLAGCGTAKENAANNNQAGASNQAQTEASPTPAAEEGAPVYPLTVSSTVASTENEEKGTVLYKDVTFEKMPEKIVVFDYGFLDTLAALEVDGIVGLPKDSTLPEHLQQFASDEYTSVGTLKSPLLEDIAELDPDVIFISGRQSTFYEELNEIAPVVFVGTSQDDYWNTFLASVEIAKQMFGKDEKAAEYTSQFDAKLAEVNELASKFPSTLVAMYNEGKLSGFAKESRFGYIYDIYGFTPVTDDIEASSHGSNFGYEAILEFNPEVLFVIDRTAATGGQSNIQADIENDIIKKSTAFQNGHIVYLDGPLWYTSGGGLTSELAKIDEILNELK